MIGSLFAQTRDPATLPAGLYLRLSDDKRLGTDREAEGVAAQEKTGTAHIQYKGWPLHSVITDNDMSAKDPSLKRPGFEELLRLIRTNQIKVVVAWAADRLSRNAREGLELIEACMKHGVIISIVRGQELDLSIPQNVFTLELGLSLARLENAQKADRQKAANAFRRSLGMAFAGGRTPFGYVNSSLSAVAPDQAEHIRAGYKYIQAGGSVGGLTKKWAEDEIWNPETNRPFTTEGVRSMLMHPRYAGILTHEGAEVGEGAWEPIVDLDTLRSVQAILSSPARRVNVDVGTALRYLLPNIALCGRCLDEGHVNPNGTPVTMKTGYIGHKNNGSEDYRRRVYVCSRKEHLKRLAEPVEEAVTEALLGRLAAPKAQSLLLDRARPDIDALRVRAEELRDRRASVTRMLGKGLTDEAEAEAQLLEISSLLKDVETAMQDGSKVPVLADILNAAEDAGKDLVARAAAVHGHWRGLSLERQRAIIAMLLKVTLYPGKPRKFDLSTVVIENLEEK